jgi:hypothetical protein
MARFLELSYLGTSSHGVQKIEIKLSYFNPKTGLDRFSIFFVIKLKSNGPFMPEIHNC